MGNKRKRSKKSAVPSSTNHRKIWHEQVVDELLSFLHSQVAILDPATEKRNKNSFDDVDKQIAEHLNDWCADGGGSLDYLSIYSAKQVRTKLCRIHAELRRTKDPDWTILYTQGIACLTWEDDVSRQARIIRRSKEIKHEWKLEFLYSPRKTRADSLARSSPQATSQTGSIGPSRGPSLFRTPKPSRGTRSHPLRQSRASEDVLHISDTESLMTDDEKILTKAECTSEKSNTLYESRLGEVHSLESPTGKTQDLSSLEIDAFDTPPGNRSLASRSKAASTGHWADDPSLLQLKERLKAVEDELHMVRTDAELELDFWKAGLRKAQDERLKERKAKDALAAALNNSWSSDSSEVISDALVKQGTLLDHLIEERNSRHMAQSFKTSMDTGPDNETVTEVCKLMHDVRRGLQAILSDVDVCSTLELQSLRQDHQLWPLLELTFGFHPRSAEAMEFEQQWQGEVCLRQYSLLALCGAALSLWVFQQSQADLIVDRYQDASTRSSTCRYRQAIDLVGHSDPALARYVDSIIHKKLAGEATFERFQEFKAKHLARKLLEALAPLIKTDANGGAQSNIDEDEASSAVNRLSDVLKRAFEVHFRLVLTGWRYESVWHEVGERFDKNTMSSCMGKQGTCTESPTVRLTLLPGIYQITASRVSSIDFGGFVGRRHRDREGAVCVVPAVVLRNNAELH